MNTTAGYMEIRRTSATRISLPLFKAEHFDAAAWIDLFKKAGAKYVVPVAEHHDGFQMYRSDISHWNAFEMGPHRDVLGELTEEMHKNGLVNGASTHRIEHWFLWDMGGILTAISPVLKKREIYTGLPCRRETIRIYSANPSPPENSWRTGWCGPVSL